jgi:hypothetical protein
MEILTAKWELSKKASPLPAFGARQVQRASSLFLKKKKKKKTKVPSNAGWTMAVKPQDVNSKLNTVHKNLVQTSLGRNSWSFPVFTNTAHSIKSPVHATLHTPGRAHFKTIPSNLMWLK